MVAGSNVRYLSREWDEIVKKEAERPEWLSAH